jgi:hypothetical protein
LLGRRDELLGVDEMFGAHCCRRVALTDAQLEPPSGPLRTVQLGRERRTHPHALQWF